MKPAFSLTMGANSPAPIPMPRVAPTDPAMACAPASHRRRRLLAGSLLPWLLGACAEAAPLRLVGHPWPGYEPMFLASTLGYLPSDLRLQEAATQRESTHQLRSGQAEGGMLTLDEVLQLRDQGLALQIVLVFDISRGADMVLGRPGLRSLSDLRRRRLGLEDSALGHLMLSLALEQAGLQRHEVTVLPLPYEQHEAAWAGNHVDALITYEPVAGRLLAGGARQLLSTRQLPQTVFDVLAMRPEALARHAERLRASLAGYFQALAYLRQNPWDAAYRVAPRLKISAEALIDSLRGLELPDRVGNQTYLSGANSALLQAARRLSPVMQQAGLLRQAVDTEGLVSALYLPKA